MHKKSKFCRGARLGVAAILAGAGTILSATADPHASNEYDTLKSLSDAILKSKGKVSVIEQSHDELSWARDRLAELTYTSPDQAQQQARPRSSNTKIRLAQWNIERGYTISEIEKLLTQPEAFAASYAKSDDADARPDQIKNDAAELAAADIFVLSELDRGICRTGYVDTFKKLARATGTYGVYATEFLELEPRLLGTETNKKLIAGEPACETVDPSRVHNQHGNAILSKFPIISAEKIELTLNDEETFNKECDNWTVDQASALNLVDRGRKVVAKIYGEKRDRELRLGARNAIIATLQIDNNRKLRVVSTHLEDRGSPKCRLLQLEQILDRLDDLARQDGVNDVLLSGDMNTIQLDGRKSGVIRYFLGDGKWKKVVLHRGIAAIPVAGQFINLGLAATTAIRQLNDPFGRNIWGLLEKPEEPFRKRLEKEEFDMGGKDKSRVYNHQYAGRLAYSNQRAKKGYEATHYMAREFGPVPFGGTSKIDWNFCKGLRCSNGRTYRGLKGLSDHIPTAVDFE